MPQAKQPAARRPAAPSLPPISVLRFERALELVDRLVDANTDAFIQHGQAYKERHRDASSRPLNAVEAAQIAAGLIDDTDAVTRVQAIQDSDLRAYDEPGSDEVLLAAGVHVAPALLDAALMVTALIEMPADRFEQACDAQQLEEALDRAAAELKREGLKDMRTRATRALEHFADAAGFSTGKALGLVTKAIWQALSQAMTHLSPESEAGSPSASLTGSAPPTADSPAATSSTA